MMRQNNRAVHRPRWILPQAIRLCDPIFAPTARLIHSTSAMHYLHPRSRTTGTLFTATLAVSFLVVAAPHLLPCPVDRRQYADTIEMPDGTIKRRRRQKQTDEEDPVLSGDDRIVHSMSSERPKRECPVPKPGGFVGQIMGFERKERPSSPEVMVRPLREQRRGASAVDAEANDG